MASKSHCVRRGAKAVAVGEMRVRGPVHVEEEQRAERRVSRRSTLPFQTRRASSYLASPATTSSPRTLRRRLSMSASVRVVPVPASVVEAIVMLMALQIGGFEVYQLQGRLREALGVPSHDSLTSLVYSPLCEWEGSALQTFCPLLEISPDTGVKGQRAPRFLGGAGRPLQ